MKIILFGASGRLGSAIQRVLPEHKYLTPSGAEVDITNPVAVESYINQHTDADWIINCAAYNDTNGAESNPDRANALNGTAPGTIAAAALQHNIPFIHFSTDYVFDGTKVEGYTETDSPNPESAYAKSKHLGEMEVTKNNPNAYIIRTSRLYGLPGNDPNGKRSFVEIVLKLAAEKPELSMNNSEISAPTLVDDIVRHIETYIFSKPAPGVYHMANQGGCTWYEWAKEILVIKNLNIPLISFLPEPNSQIKKPAYSMLLSTKLPPMRPWQNALRDFLQSSQI